MRLGWGVAAAAVVLVTLAILAMTPGVGFDAARGLLASEQRLRDRGNRLSEIVVADPSDLNRDVRETISWWPPGQQLVVFGLRRLGIPLDRSLRIVTAAAWIIGLIAWSRYFLLVLGPDLAPWLVALFVLFRASHQSGYLYTGGDTVLWALVPLAALVNVQALARARAGGALAAGLLAAVLILFKYSAGAIAIGFALAWGWILLRGEIRPSRLAWWILGAGTGALLAVAAGLGRAIAGLTPADALVSHPLPVAIAWGVAGPLMALTDLFDLSIVLAGRLGFVPATNRIVAMLAVFVSLVFGVWALLARHAAFRRAGVEPAARAHAFRCAVCIAAAVTAMLIALLVRGGSISWEGRHHQYGAFLLLPFLAGALYRAAREGSGLARAASAIAALLFLALPAAYGAGTLVHRLFVEIPAERAAVTPDGVPLDWMGRGAAAPAFARAVASVPGFDAMLLATVSPRAVLGLPRQRVLFVMEGGEWRSDRFLGRPVDGVALLTPAGLDPAHVASVRQSFVDIREWQLWPLPAVPNAHLWVAR